MSSLHLHGSTFLLFLFYFILFWHKAAYVIRKPSEPQDNLCLEPAPLYAAVRVLDSMGKPLSSPQGQDALEQFLPAGAISFPYLADCGTGFSLHTKILSTKY